jgi:hypothetical protein
MIDDEERAMEEYGDIIFTPTPLLLIHRRQPRDKRAAQFSPFDALTGFDESIDETSRLTEEKIELDENRKEELNGKLSYLVENKQEKIQATFIYFVKDIKKEGGKYVTTTSCLKSYNEITRYITLMNLKSFSVDDLFDINSSVFSNGFDQ